MRIPDTITQRSASATQRHSQQKVHLATTVPSVRTRSGVAAVYYGGLLLVLTMIVTKVQPPGIPGAIAGRISRNSEGLVVLLGVSLWIEFVRRRAGTSTQALTSAILGAIGWLIIGLFLRFAPLPPQWHTLNEAALALAVLVPYLQLRRPLPGWVWLLPLAAVAVPLVGGSNPVTTDLAEAFGALVLIPLCVDVVDRGIIDGSRPPLARVLAWMAFLMIAVVALHALFDPTPTGFVAEIIRYASRVTEMFLASLFLHGYFSLLRPDLRAAPSRVGNRQGASAARD